MHFKIRFLAFGLALILFPAGALAGDFVKLSNPNPADAEQYWTPDRYREARPLPIAAAMEMDLNAFDAEIEEEAALPSVFAPGRAPTAGIRPDRRNLLFEPLGDEPAALAGEAVAGLTPITAPASGSAGAYFTSSRLVPSTADTAFPYSAVGKLFFTVPGRGDFYCTAAVIKARILLTAAQCIHSGTSSPGFFTNFSFVPAYRNGAAPFGTWDWNYVVVNTTWTKGGGRLPNAADYGMIEMDDEVINGALRKLGDVVGWLGYQTQKLRPNHAHLLAYCSNFDGGGRIHQVTAQSFRNAAQNNVEYGSDMRGGSAGGPLIQDFGDNAALVRVIGVLSYYSGSAKIKVEGASIPDNRFTGLLSMACAHRAGNC
jgi:V8-like Glu-specific endopeptidase